MGIETVGIFYGGIGHWAIAAERAELDVQWYHEKADWAVKIFSHNYPSIKVIESSPQPVDLIIGSPWCVGMSQANPKAHIEHPANRHVMHFADAVDQAQPRMFIMEIVNRFYSEKFRPVQEEWTSRLKSNYYLCALELDAQDYGSAQVRKRLFIIGSHTMQLKKNLMPEQNSSVKVADIIGKYEDEEFIIGEDMKEWKDGMAGPWGCLKGDKWKNRMLKKDGKCFTITSTSDRDQVHYNGKRLMATIELKALMGFPEDYDLLNTRVSGKARKIASGVDINCVTQLLKKVKELA